MVWYSHLFQNFPQFTVIHTVKGFGINNKAETDLKLNIQKTNIMVSGPITSWQIDGETVLDFIFGGYKITADGD